MSSGHTYRKCYWKQSDLQFSDNRETLKHADGWEEIPVTMVDIVTNYSKNLNKDELWNIAFEVLEEECISKNYRYDKSTQTVKTVYEVPIVGHEFFLKPKPDEEFCMLGGRPLGATSLSAQEKKIKMNPSQYMYWEGQYYSTEFIYSVAATVGGPTKFRPVAPLTPPLPPQIVQSRGIVEYNKHLSYHNSRGIRLASCSIKHDRKQYRHGGSAHCWHQWQPDDFLEINMGCPRYVTHIGTAGCTPELSIFPSHLWKNDESSGLKKIGRGRRYRCVDPEANNRYSNKLDNLGCKSKFAPYIYTTTPRDVLHHTSTSTSTTTTSGGSWVTSFDVYFREPVSKRWFLLASALGNSNPFDEVLLDLKPFFTANRGVYTQHLRIKPTGHHLHPRLRVAVYGAEVITTTTPTTTNTTRSADDVDTTSILHRKKKKKKQKKRTNGRIIEEGEEEEGKNAATTTTTTTTTTTGTTTSSATTSVTGAGAATGTGTTATTVQYVIDPGCTGTHVRDNYMQSSSRWRNAEYKRRGRRPKAKNGFRDLMRTKQYQYHC